MEITNGEFGKALALGNGIDSPTNASVVFKARADLKKVSTNLNSTKADIDKAKHALATTLEEQGQNLNETGIEHLRQAAKVFGLESKLPRAGFDCHISEEQEAEIQVIRDDMEAFRDSDQGQELLKSQQEIHLEHGVCERVSNSFGNKEGVKTVKTTSTYSSAAEHHLEHLQLMSIAHDQYMVEGESEETPELQEAK